MRSDYREILKRYWGYDDFRGIQREIIGSISSGHDTLGLMPTGGGKSITFQVPALAMEGTCIVITPLIALMKDQVIALRRRGIHAAAVYSGMHHDEIIATLENAVFGQVKILYVSPERLGSDLFRAKLRHMKVSFITVDEAHCISQWGYDFRPAYLAIADIRRDVPDAAVLALTATATPAVVKDIQLRLARPDTNPAAAGNPFNVFRMSFERKNLAYIVRQAADKRDELLHVLAVTSGPAIVYVRSRRRSGELADMLQKAGVSATFYHAGLDNTTKDERQKMWLQDKTRVMVATNAFGMGIDKPDVGIVVHYDCPDSIEAYFQEAGRAGRNGLPAKAIMLYNGSDKRKLVKRIADNFPEKEYVRQVYEHLAYYYEIGTGSGYNRVFEFNIDDFCRKFHHFPITVLSAVQILERAGYVEYIEEEEARARVMFVLGRDELDRLSHTSPDEERVVTALLRSYGGLFVDFVFIDEAFVAHESGLTQVSVYMTLKQLAAKRILRFIPQKRTPYIRYMQRREDSEHLFFPPQAYDELKARYTERINAMTDYLEDNAVCRSRFLLRYFGEQSAHDCGQCDVCLDHEPDGRQTPEPPAGAGTVADAETQIRRLLADRHRHHITELRGIKLPYGQIDVALQRLVDDEIVLADDGFLCLS